MNKPTFDITATPNQMVGISHLIGEHLMTHPTKNKMNPRETSSKNS
ncbi:hypothetical protein [Moraxella sp. Pampa]|nr:hypothetical protein [Moraxella sp. Pampa]